MLTKKIQLQPMRSVRIPPTIGPIASESAETPAQMPIAVPRCRAGKVAVMIDSVAGFSSAAPTPCTLRAAISEPALPARPHHSEAAVKIDEPDDEDPAPPEQVGELSAGEEQDAERQRVGVDHPLELRDRDAQIRADRGQRDVHDRVVEHDHEQAERDGDQGPPLAVLVREQAGPHVQPPRSSPARGKPSRARRGRA